MGKTLKLGIAASALAMAVHGSAYAQDAQSAAPVQTNENIGIADIVVTAQKRSESLQKTPAAVTAYTGDALVQSGTTDLRAVQNIIPNARFQQEGATTQVILRGIGSNLDFGNVEPTVAFNINGVFIPREGTSAPIFDIDRIEVLPGPQGTLYGRNALGGTINLSLKRPSRDLETSGVIEVGNYSLVHATFVQNVPLSEDLAVRGAVDYTYHKGYMESGAYSKDDLAGRLGVLYDPSEDFKLYIWGSAAIRDGHPSNLVNKGLDPTTFTYSENAYLRDRPWDDLRPGALAGTAIFGQPVAEQQKYDNFVLGAQVDIGVGDGLTLTYVPGFFSLRSSSDYWLGVIPAYKTDNYDVITQELRLAGDSDKLDWLLGIYAYRQVTKAEAFVGRLGGPFFFRSSGVLRHRVKGAALFGQATYSVSDSLRLTAGGRMSGDDREAAGVSNDVGNLPYTFSRKYSRFDFKLGGEYDLTPTAMAYLTYQTGYQPGTFNEVPSTPTQENAIKPPKLSSITGGLKTRFLDNTLQINAEAFYYDYKDLLVQAYDASKPYNPIFNAKATTYGVQVDLVFQPTNEDRLTTSIGYLHARLKEYDSPGLSQYNGFSPPYAADWTINAGYSHDFQLSAGYVRAHADVRYESAFYADFVHSLGVRQKPAAKGNASLTYYAEDESWTIGAWIKNITNEAVLAATAAAGIPGPGTAYLEEPRTFGVRSTFKF